ncbi:fluoride efflux transporter CrcB [Prevotella sp. oral taxon 376]|uniref:fluoride efflux transporter CrcB n=1 Tax=Prevotella sp. oral taxon 376 TaxID=712466 RepID=UPI000D1D7C88|nr:fluoride efflux transporter CrcB [Prevotella sp. oral taxon 376]PTL33082.1 fluoride efflux transporter CrcB [Prevotella sp. oral taxon 376]
MIKDFLLVGMGSFVGGGVRLLVSRWVQSLAVMAFPWGTFAVNILGCLLIGLLSGLPSAGHLMSANTRLVLTTGFCGGFTTFSTFMNENSALLKDGNHLYLMLYVSASLAAGFLALLLGSQLAKLF